MAERLRLFVSITADLEVEREIIGRAVAELPVDLGWVIKTTPTDRQPAREIMEAVGRCDFYVLLLGADITAPVGLELTTARRAGKALLAYLKRDVMRTPAAQVFIRDARVEWVRYASATELQRHFRERLVQHLLEHAVEYRLQPVEYETLRAFLQELRGEEGEEGAEAEDERRGAGGGGVIISPTRDIPRGGVPVGEARPGDPSASRFDKG